MDLKKIIEEDNKKMENNELLKKTHKNVIKEFEKDSKLWEDLTNKLAINTSYRDEVHKFFIDMKFVKSNEDHKGRINMSNLTTYYKNQNTWIAVSFSEYSETENIIEIIRLVENQGYRLTYKLNDDAMKTIELKNGFRLNGDLVHIGNYKDVISKCNSIKELNDLDTQLKEHIQYLEDNLNKDINTDGVYQLVDGNQFKTFEEAFTAL